MTSKSTCRSRLMAGKTCLITGATVGIGRVTALEVAHMGAAVVIAGRDPAKCALAANDIREESGNPDVEFLVADLSSQEEVRCLADEFRNRHQRLDVLVNNASAFGPRVEIWGYPEEAFRQVLDVNVAGVFLVTRAVLRAGMLEQGGHIVNLSSSAGRPISGNAGSSTIATCLASSASGVKPCRRK